MTFRNIETATFLFAAAVASTAIGCAGESRNCEGPSSARVVSTAGTASRVDSNKAIVQRLHDELWGKKNLAAVDAAFAPDFVNHSAIPEAQGAAGMKTIASKLIAAFPDLKMEVLSLVGEGDVVILRVAADGTHTGRLDFKTPLPPTNRHMRVEQVHTFRLQNDRIVESWMVQDRLDVMTQLGVVPRPTSN